MSCVLPVSVAILLFPVVAMVDSRFFLVCSEEYPTTITEQNNHLTLRQRDRLRHPVFLPPPCRKNTVSQKKLCQCYFVNNSVKRWPNLIIFGRQHREET